MVRSGIILATRCCNQLPEPIRSTRMRSGKAVKSVRGGGLVAAAQATR
jgi:hypothetical protein